jgi:hypothetical protein
MSNVERVEIPKTLQDLSGVAGEVVTQLFPLQLQLTWQDHREIIHRGISSSRRGRHPTVPLPAPADKAGP